MKSLLLSCILVFFPTILVAEVAYIIDQLKAGLHENKSVESPIVKIVATGTRLEIVKREDKLTFVRDDNGITGWISNEYLMAKAPASASFLTTKTRADNLETRLAESREKIIALETNLKSQGKVLPAETRAYAGLKTVHADLSQKFKAQKLKIGELQIELTELRNRVGQDSDGETLYRQIKSLEDSKKKLEIELANTLDKYTSEGANGRTNRPGQGDLSEGFSPGIRNMIIYLLVTLVLGMFGGAYILDLINRRRHGGFRI
jgi:SH3 domain protein